MKHDKTLLQRRFARNLKSYDTLAVVQRAIADRLGERLAQAVGPAVVRRGAEIGAGTGFLTRHLVRLFPAAEWTVNDLVPASRAFLPPVTGTGIPVRFEAGDGEAFRFDTAGYDLIASTSAVQWFDDLPGFILRAAAGLAAGGTLAFSTFGPENFREIAATTGQGLDYYPLEELCALCRGAGLTLSVAEAWIEPQYYPAPTDVLRHLRLTGVNAVTAQRWTHSRLSRFEADYRSAYTVAVPDDSLAGGSGSGRERKKGGECVTLTFHPIIIVAQKP